MEQVPLVDRLETEREALLSPSGEKTGSSSRSSSGRSASSQSGLSRPASAAIVAQGSVSKERGNRLDGPVDLGLAVRSERNIASNWEGAR